MKLEINKYKISFLLIFLLGVILRFYNLGLNPPSLNWDETSIGYNAYSVLKTGNDEYGNFLPSSFRSFDDHKPPVYIYLTVPSVAIFGLTEFAVRFPSAFFGSIAILLVYLLSLEIFSNLKNSSRNLIALLSSFFIAISPWHLQFSRAAYEGNIGLFFILLGTLLFFYGLKNGKFLVFSSLAFILSLYSYHSFRLIIPIYLAGILIIFYKKIFNFKKSFIIASMIFILLAFPVYLSFINQQGTGSRLSMVTIFSESEALRQDLVQLQVDRENGNILGIIFNNRRVYFFREAVKGYLDHLNPTFLFVTGAGSYHHHAVNFGMQYLWELPFMVIGFYYLIRNKSKKIFTILLLLLIAPLPASITTGTPHGVRAIAMVPGLVFLTASGCFFLYEKTRKLNKTQKYVGILIISILLIVNFMYYLNQYYSTTPRVYGYFWQFGNKEAIAFAKRVENENEKIIISFQYDQPYIYYLFYNKIDPFWYQKNWDTNRNGKIDRFYRKIGKYEFRNINFEKDKKLSNAILIGTPKEIARFDGVIKEILFPDGEIAYRIYKTNP